MRRKHRKHNQSNANISIYVTGGILLVAIIAFVISFIVYSKQFGEEIYSFDTEYLAKYNEIEEKNDITSASSTIGKTIEESKQDFKSKSVNEATKTKNNNTTKKKNDYVENTASKKATNSSEKVEKDPAFQKPIEGEIIKEFAKNNLIYSETLKEWITHLGIDIKAEKATVVKAAAAGTIKYIKNDPRFGLTIIIEHNNGFETRYANLLTTEFVAEGEKVKAGQTIGTVGDTSIYEVVDEPHLHFEILKNNENLNPNQYIQF